MTINAALREHVTSVGFALTLTKNHIRALVFLALAREGRLDNGQWPDTGERSWFVPAVNGLRNRGLVEHHFPPKRYKGDPAKFHERRSEYGPADFYPITMAGDLVCQLLAECGLFAEAAETYRTRLKVAS